MLIFILIDVKYFHNDVFSFEKGSIHQNHSLNYHNQFRVFIVSTIYVNNDMFEADLFFLYTNDSCLLYQHTMSKNLGENLNKKLSLVH